MSLPTTDSASAVPVVLSELPLEASSDLPCSASASSLESSSALNSTSSTPPTSVSDTCSQSSEAAKLENITVALGTPPHPVSEVDPEQEHVGSQYQSKTRDTISATLETPPDTTPSRPRRAARAISTYNISKLSGTAVHGKRRANGDTVNEKRRRVTVSGAALTSDSAWSLDQLDTPPATRRGARQEGSASAGPTTRRASTRLSKEEDTTPAASRISSLGKRGKKALEKATAAIPRELRRLQDTDEFAHIDKKPVYHTVWSNGKYVPVNAKPQSEPARKKTKLAVAPAGHESTEENDIAAIEAAAPVVKKRKVKKYLEKGLYAGQDLPNSYIVGLTHGEKKKLAQIPELKQLPEPNRVLPLPIYNGLRLLIKGRDYKLPFDVCNPLPPGQPKPDEWRKMTKSEPLYLIRNETSN